LGVIREQLFLPSCSTGRTELLYDAELDLLAIAKFVVVTIMVMINLHVLFEFEILMLCLLSACVPKAGGVV